METKTDTDNETFPGLRKAVRVLSAIGIITAALATLFLLPVFSPDSSVPLEAPLYGIASGVGIYFLAGLVRIGLKIEENTQS